MNIINTVAMRLDEWREQLSNALLIRPVESMIKRVDGREFFDESEFPWTGEFAGHWQEIRAELDELLGDPNAIPSFQTVSPHQRALTNDDRWKTHIFYVHGNRCEENCVRCPRTVELLQTIPGLESAMFSILAPRKHIARHRGPYAGVLRYHLGLIVPEAKERCRIQVGGSTRHWEEGKGLVFDDSHEHEVWNDTDELRAVLFVDFVRPMPYPLSLWNGLVVRSLTWAPMARTAARNARAWSRQRWPEGGRQSVARAPG